MAADHHIVGAAQQAAAVSSLNSAVSVATPPSPFSTTIGGNTQSFNFGSTSPAAKTSAGLFSQPSVSNAPQPAVSNAGAFGGAPASSGTHAATANLHPLTANLRAQLMEANTLWGAITMLQAHYPQRK